MNHPRFETAQRYYHDLCAATGVEPEEVCEFASDMDLEMWTLRTPEGEPVFYYDCVLGSVSRHLGWNPEGYQKYGEECRRRAEEARAAKQSVHAEAPMSG